MQEAAEQTNIDAVPATQSTVTLVPPAHRAAVALRTDDYKKQIAEKIKESADIVAVVDPDGRMQAHRVGMVLTKLGTAIQATGKAARADATAFSKAVVAAENELLALVTPEKERVLALRDGYDKKVREEEEARAAAERERIGAIEAGLADLRANVPWCVGKTAAQILGRSVEVANQDMSAAVWQEYLARAVEVHADVLAQMGTAFESQEAVEEAAALAKREAEAEAARVAAQAEENRLAAIELQRQRDELAAQQKADADRLAAQQKADANRLAAKMKADQDAIDAAQRIANEALAVKQAELAAAEARLQAQRDELDQRQRDQDAAEEKRRADAQKAEDDRIEAERVAALPVAVVVAALEGVTSAPDAPAVVEVPTPAPEAAVGHAVAPQFEVEIDELHRAVLTLHVCGYTDAVILAMVSEILQRATV